jgi:hypothetical protein
LRGLPAPNGGRARTGPRYGSGHVGISVGDGGCYYMGDSGCQGKNDASRDRHVLLGKALRT